jgi:nitrite reductase/ring-hydroxylating ferredoxin subunit
VADLPVGGMKVGRVGDHRVLLVRTGDGVHALDHACPHQGYGLAQGDLDAERGLLTCTWHNWKFRLDDGTCVLGGGEPVRTHAVRIDGDDAVVEVVEPTPEEERARLLPSLREGIAEDRPGRMARDVVRLLRAGTAPADLVLEGVRFAGAYAEFGWHHGLAVAADAVELLATGDLIGDERAFPIVTALAGIAESDVRRLPRWRPLSADGLPANPEAAFRSLIEREDAAGAEALVLAALDAGTAPDELRPWFVGAVSDHHLSFGHEAIYTQKAFSLIGHLGASCAVDVLPGLAHSIVVGTREEQLPYFRAAAAEVRGADLWALAAAPDRRSTGWVDDGERLHRAILDDPSPPVAAAVHAALDGAGIEGLLDAVVLAASARLLRHDPAEDAAPTDFGWLDITHVLTYADAARWAWRSEPGPDAARLALWTVLMASDSGRAERRRREPVRTPEVEPRPGDLRAAVEAGAADDAVAHALALPADEAGRQLERAAQSDLAGSWIVAAHLVKTARAARREAAIVGSNLPLAATARFCASPRVERFVAATTTEAIHVVDRGVPLPR